MLKRILVSLFLFGAVYFLNAEATYPLNYSPTYSYGYLDISNTFAALHGGWTDGRQGGCTREYDSGYILCKASGGAIGVDNIQGAPPDIWATYQHYCPGGNVWCTKYRTLDNPLVVDANCNGSPSYPEVLDTCSCY